jgi:hypothetical protein
VKRGKKWMKRKKVCEKRKKMDEKKKSLWKEKKNGWKEKKLSTWVKVWAGGRARENFILGTWFCSPNSWDLRVVCQPPVCGICTLVLDSVSYSIRLLLFLSFLSFHDAVFS